VADERQPPGEWNPGSLHSHFTERINDLHENFQGQLDRRIGVEEREREAVQKQLSEAIAALERNVEKTERFTNERLNALNKLREQALADRNLYVSKDVLDSKLAGVTDQVAAKVETLETRIERLDADRERRRGGELVDRRRIDLAQPWQIWLAGAVLAVLIVALNLLTGGG
jgi:exonuclease VII large subunit